MIKLESTQPPIANNFVLGLGIKQCLQWTLGKRKLFFFLVALQLNLLYLNIYLYYCYTILRVREYFQKQL